MKISIHLLFFFYFDDIPDGGALDREVGAGAGLDSGGGEGLRLQCGVSHPHLSALGEPAGLSTLVTIGHKLTSLTFNIDLQKRKICEYCKKTRSENF